MGIFCLRGGGHPFPLLQTIIPPKSEHFCENQKFPKVLKCKIILIFFSQTWGSQTFSYQSTSTSSSSTIYHNHYNYADKPTHLLIKDSSDLQTKFFAFFIFMSAIRHSFCPPRLNNVNVQSRFISDVANVKNFQIHGFSLRH